FVFGHDAPPTVRCGKWPPGASTSGGCANRIPVRLRNQHQEKGAAASGDQRRPQPPTPRLLGAAWSVAMESTEPTLGRSCCCCRTKIFIAILLVMMKSGLFRGRCTSRRFLSWLGGGGRFLHLCTTRAPKGVLFFRPHCLLLCSRTRYMAPTVPRNSRTI